MNIYVFCSVLLLDRVIFGIAEFQCVGTCYAGRLFPKTEDIFHGKHLKGFSYKNITTDDPRKCYSSCVHDCSCKACQMKDARCELLDEDKTSKADNFVDGSGYVYYDLKQKMYQGKSHMLPPGVCHNGCCRSNPCLNGGTCVEHCQSPKEKLTCKCPVSSVGKFCEKRIQFTSCLDVLRYSNKGETPRNGNYLIMRKQHQSKLKIQTTFYCAFEKPKRAWTLIESFSASTNKHHKTLAFHVNGKGKVTRRNNGRPNWIDYFEGRRVVADTIRINSTMFRVTCDFSYRSSLLPDYLFGYLSDYDIINHGDVTGGCFKFAHINIRGYDFFNATAGVFHVSGKYHFFIDGYNEICGFKVPESSKGEANFGYYNPMYNTSVCTASDNSTTQYWLGGELV